MYQEETDRIAEIVQKYSAQGRDVILLGDLNTDIRKPQDPDSKYLLYTTASIDLHLPVKMNQATRPTLYHHNGYSTSILDYIFLSEKLLNYCKEYNIQDHSSQNISSHTFAMANTRIKVSKENEKLPITSNGVEMMYPTTEKWSTKQYNVFL